jgi:hypothetical protein
MHLTSARFLLERLFYFREDSIVFLYFSQVASVVHPVANLFISGCSSAHQSDELSTDGIDADANDGHSKINLQQLHQQ